MAGANMQIAGVIEEVLMEKVLVDEEVVKDSWWQWW